MEAIFHQSLSETCVFYGFLLNIASIVELAFILFSAWLWGPSFGEFSSLSLLPLLPSFFSVPSLFFYDDECVKPPPPDPSLLPPIELLSDELLLLEDQLLSPIPLIPHLSSLLFDFYDANQSLSQIIFPSAVKPATDIISSQCFKLISVMLLLVGDIV